MKFLFLLSLYSSLHFYASQETPLSASPEAQVKAKILAFAKAIEQRDQKQLAHLLHKDFRVIANQYPQPSQLTLLPKSLYLSLIEQQKIGGTAYRVQFEQVAVAEHSATVIAKFEGAQNTMHLSLLLIKEQEEWFLISDLARME